MISRVNEVLLKRRLGLLVVFG